MSSQKIRYALISKQRSGTKFFKLTLSKHPEIFTYPEILSVNGDKWKRPENVHHFMIDRFTRDPSSLIENRNRENYKEYIEHLYNSSDSHVVGLDLKYNQLDQFDTFKSCLTKTDVRVIHLIRKNVLRQHLSEIQYKLLDRSSIPEGKIYEIGALPITAVTLDCDERLLTPLTKAIEQIEDNRHFLKANFEYLEVYYESFIPKGQLFADSIPTQILQDTYDFLDIEDRLFTPQVTRKAQHPYPIRDLILNYEEVHTFLSKEGLSHLLNDDYGKSTC